MPEFGQDNLPNRPVLRGILQDERCVLFYTGKVIKIRGSLREGSRLKKTKNSCRLNAACDPGLDLGTRKGHGWDTRQNLDGVYRVGGSTVSMFVC